MSGVAGLASRPREARAAPRRLAGSDAGPPPSISLPALPSVASTAPPAAPRPVPRRPALASAAPPPPSLGRSRASAAARIAETVRSLRRRTEHTLAAIARAAAAGSCASAASSAGAAAAPRRVARPPPIRPAADAKADPSTRASTRSETLLRDDRAVATVSDPKETEPLAVTGGRGNLPAADAARESRAAAARPAARRDGPGPVGAFPGARPARAQSPSSPKGSPAGTPDRSEDARADDDPLARTESTARAGLAAAPETRPPPPATRATEKTTASDLPADALELTFAFLPPRALAFAGATCRAWRDAAARERLWARLLAKRGGAEAGAPARLDETTKPTKTVFGETFSLESRWRAGKYARHDLHRHTWTVERVELVDTRAHGRVVVTGGWDGQAFAWRLKKIPNENENENGDGVASVWEPFRAFLGPGGAWVSALDATPSLVAAGDTNGRVWVWGYDAPAPRRAWHHGGSVTSVRFAPETEKTEKTFVASASTDGDVKVWCVATGYLLATARGHADVCWHVRFIASLCDADAAFAVTAGRDGLAKTWRVPLRARSGDDDDDGGAGDGAAGVPSGSAGREARVSEPATAYVVPYDARCERTLRAHDDAILAVATWDPPPSASSSFTSSSRDARHTPLLATCGADGVVAVWRAEDGARVATLRGHAGGVLCASFAVWDERLTLVTGSADKTVRVWDVASGSCLGAVADHGAPVTEVAARADALATIAPGDGVVAYWRPVDAAEAAEAAEAEASERAPEASARPSGLRACMTLMDGAGSGFSACLAMDRQMLAMGTKTGSVQVLDFRRNAA